MAENLLTALEITLMGMSLIFAGIVLLWGLMTLLVKLQFQNPVPPSVAIEDEDLKKQVAAVAVAIALVQPSSAEPPPVFLLQGSSTLSPWQSAWRSKQVRHERKNR